MISKVKNAMSSLVGGIVPHGHHHHHHHHPQQQQQSGADSLPPRFPYARPDFLELSAELVQYAAEHASRPVITLRRDAKMPWGTGYAEWVAAHLWFLRMHFKLWVTHSVRVDWMCFRRKGSVGSVMLLHPRTNPSSVRYNATAQQQACYMQCLTSVMLILTSRYRYNRRCYAAFLYRARHTLKPRAPSPSG